MPKLGEAFVNIRANLAPLSRGLKNARTLTKNAMSGIGKLASGITRSFTRVFHTMSSVVARITRIIKRAMLVVVAAITGAIVAAVKFQTQLAMVSTMLDRTTMPMMMRFKDGLIGLAKAFGQSTATLAKGLYDILSASFSVSEGMDLLAISAKAAIAGQTDTATAVDVITGTLNAFGMGAERAMEVADKLFSTVKRGKLVFADLSNVIGMGGAMARLAGVSFEELMAITATATRQNIKASRATFSIVAALQAFLKPQKEASELAKKYGVELSVATLKTEGLAKTLAKLSKATEAELAIIIPTVRGIKSFSAAMRDSEGFAIDLALISTESAGKMEEAYRKMAARTGFKLSQVKQSLLAVAVAMGDPMLDPLDDLADAFKLKLAEIEKWAKQNKEKIKEWSEAVVTKIADIIVWIENLFDKFKKGGFGDALRSLIEDIKGAVIKAFEIIKPHAKELGKIIADGMWEGIKGIGKDTADRVMEGLKTISPLAIAVEGVRVGHALVQAKAAKEEEVDTIEGFRMLRERAGNFTSRREMDSRDRPNTMRERRETEHISALNNNTMALIKIEATNREVNR